MWSCILSVGTTLSQSLFSVSMASARGEVFPFLKLHTTTSRGFLCHYARKIKWLINLEINSQLMFGIFKYSACKHKKLQHFGNVHRTKTSGQRLSVTWYWTFYVKTYFNIAFLVTHISQITCVCLYFERKCVLYTVILKCINKCFMWEILEKTTSWGTLWSVVLTQYCVGDKLKKNEIGGACGMYGGGERRVQCFGGENWGKETTWGDPGTDGRIILRWIFRKLDVGVWTGSSWLRIGTGGGHLWMR